MDMTDWLRPDWGKFCVDCKKPIEKKDERVCDPCCKECADRVFGVEIEQLSLNL